MELSHQSIKDAIKLALCQRSGVTYGWYVIDLYDTYAIVEGPDDKLYSVPYTKSGGEGDAAETVEVGADLTPVQRLIHYMPITEALGGRLLEAVENSQGTTWRVLMIEPGISKNGTMYTADVLKTAAPLFEGVRALARADADHVRGTNVDPVKLVGWFDNVSYVEGQGMVGTFNITADSSWLSLKLTSAWEKGKPDLLGFSIVAGGRGRRVLHEGKLVVWVDAIEAANFVDVVVNPSAGGRLLEMVESDSAQRGREQVHAELIKETATMERWLKLIESKYPDVYAQIDLENVTEDQLIDLLTEATATETAPPVTPQTQTTVVEADATEGGTALLTRMIEATANLEARAARLDLTEALSQSNLPGPITEKLQQQLGAQIDVGNLPSMTEINALIESERTMLSQLSQPGIVTGLGRQATLVTEDEMDKAVKALDNVFSQAEGATSFKEAYISLTGDNRITGQLAEAHNLHHLRNYCQSKGILLTESLTSSSFDAVLADTLRRRVLAEYTRLDLNSWRSIVEVVPLPDFRTNHRTRFGGYGNLPGVAEEASYLPLTSPTDEEATYAPTKRGGTEKITIEMIANDDVRAIRRIPINLGRAAAQTLHEFVFDFISGNAAIYDSVALFHASHNNLLTTAFGTDATQFFAHRTAMRQQTDMDNGKRLGLTPAHLLIPGELENAAFDAFTVGDNNDETFAKRVKPMIHTIDYWTDANNFYTVCDPRDCPTIEIGFWNGEEPQLLVQDRATDGSMFSNDQRTYRIRHVYGGTVLDYRGFQGSIVA